MKNHSKLLCFVLVNSGPATCVAFSSTVCCRVGSSAEVTAFSASNKVTLDLWPRISPLVPSVGSSHSNHLPRSVSSTTYQLLWQSNCMRFKDLQAYCSHMESSCNEIFSCHSWGTRCPFNLHLKACKAVWCWKISPPTAGSADPFWSLWLASLVQTTLPAMFLWSLLIFLE